MLKTQLAKFQMSHKDRLLDLFKESHARVGLGHTGGRIKMIDWLDFQAGFSQAKDAVFSQFSLTNIETLCRTLHLDYLQLESQTSDATQFLLRPDLGKLLSRESHALLEQLEIINTYDLLIIISGGLSPLAIEHQIPTFLPVFINELAPFHWTIAPIIITPRSRVAFGDQINHYFKARLTVVLIGERPGLTTPDSLGIYVTYHAKPGCTDEQRNCISNIHAHGLSSPVAAAKLTTLLKTASGNQQTGVSLEKITAQIL